METTPWYADYSKVIGILMFLGGLSLVLVGQTEIGIPLLAAASGVALGKTGTTKVAPVLLAGILAFSVMSCSAPRMVSVDAIEPALVEVINRHDAYVQADSTLDTYLKTLYLRTTELLKKLLEEAKSQ